MYVVVMVVVVVVQRSEQSFWRVTGDNNSHASAGRRDCDELRRVNAQPDLCA